MSRQYIDYREFPSAMNCSVALSADSDKELLEAAAQHAVAVHGHARHARAAQATGPDVQVGHAAADGGASQHDQRLINRQTPPGFIRPGCASSRRSGKTTH